MNIVLKRKIKTLYKLLFNPSIGQIYMLHRVSPFENGKLSFNERMKVSPEFLEKFILESLGKFDFLSLDQVADILLKKIKLRKPFIVFTFDDGYADNYQYAFPILIKYNIPFTIYVSTGFIDRISILWWYQLEEIIFNNKIVELSTGKKYPCETEEQKESTFVQLRKLILELPVVDFESSFRELFSKYTSNFNCYYNLMLNWNQIIEMSKSPLCCIAGHTINHSCLKNCSTLELEYEILIGRSRIEEMIGKSIHHFAFPFGTENEINSTVVDFVQQNGFKTATISNGGRIRKKDNNLFTLKRSMLSEI